MSRCCDIPFSIALMLAFAASAAAQQSGFKWVCDPSERHSRFYRADLGVVCWEGKTYSKDNGGIPHYMLDYFEQNRRQVQQKVDEMNRHFAELKAARQNSSAAPTPRPPVTPAPKNTATVARAEPVPIVPVAPDVFAAIEVGMARSQVLDKLGKPPGSLTIPGDDGFVEIWTYQLTDGNTAKLHIEKGVVTSLDTNTTEK